MLIHSAIYTALVRLIGGFGFITAFKPFDRVWSGFIGVVAYQAAYKRSGSHRQLDDGTRRYH